MTVRTPIPSEGLASARRNCFARRCSKGSIQSLVRNSLVKKLRQLGVQNRRGIIEQELLRNSEGCET